MPVGGSVKVQGLTAEQAQTAIEERLRQTNILHEPHVEVFVLEYATQGVTVAGEVKLPGVYPWSGKRTVLDFVSLAGGVTPAASKTFTLTHKRPAALVVTAALSDTAAPTADVEPGDLIVVTRAGIVYVVGDVGKPGGYLIENKETITVLQALALAQGMNKTAKYDAKLIRNTPAGRTEAALPLKKILANQVTDPRLQDGDILFVPVSGGKAMGRQKRDFHSADGCRCGHLRQVLACGYLQVAQLHRGLWIAFFGPDGAGKSAVIEHLATKLAVNCAGVTRFHFRPRFHSHDMDREPVTDPHAQPPRSTLVSLGKLIYWLLDCWFGYIRTIRSTSRSQIVIFDRYLPDILIDPARYRLPVSCGWFARMLVRLAPRPDLCILLDVRAEVAQRRKKEVPLAESQRQRAAYLTMFRGMSGTFVVNACCPVEEVAQQVAAVIFSMRAGRALQPHEAPLIAGL